MVSLTAVEQLAAEVWPDRNHAVIAQPDPQKGEQLVLVTDAPGATRKDLATAARAAGLGEINVPRRVVSVAKVPLLGTGKIDYKGAEHLAVHSGGMQEGSS